MGVELAIFNGRKIFTENLSDVFVFHIMPYIIIIIGTIDYCIIIVTQNRNTHPTVS